MWCNQKVVFLFCRCFNDTNILTETRKYLSRTLIIIFNSVLHHLHLQKGGLKNPWSSNLDWSLRRSNLIIHYSFLSVAVMSSFLEIYLGTFPWPSHRSFKTKFQNKIKQTWVLLKILDLIEDRH